MSRVTLSDVAKRAGVSSKTVSRVLNNEPTVAEETRNKVKQAMAELNYVPNAFAQRLSSGNAKTIGITVGWPIYIPYVGKLIEGAFKESYSNGYNISLFSIDDVGADHIIAAYIGKQVDGFILDTPSSMNLDLKAGLRAYSVPSVVVNPNTKSGFINTSFVGIDDKHAAQQSTDYLIQLGHRDIGYITADREFIHQQDRLNGYKLALEEAGIPYRNELVVFEHGVAMPDSSFAKGSELLEQFPEITAVVAGNDDIAMGVIRAIWLKGLKIPDDISVVGFDDHYYASMVTPPLTTIHQPINQLARTAVQLLIRQITDPSCEPVEKTLAAHLVVRDSCKSPRQQSRIVTHPRY